MALGGQRYAPEPPPRRSNASGKVTEPAKIAVSCLTVPQGLCAVFDPGQRAPLTYQTPLLSYASNRGNYIEFLAMYSARKFTTNLVVFNGTVLIKAAAEALPRLFPAAFPSCLMKIIATYVIELSIQRTLKNIPRNLSIFTLPLLPPSALCL